MDSIIWQFIAALGMVLGGYTTFQAFIEKRQKAKTEEALEQSGENQALELKVKELEGKIATNYNELKGEIQSLKRVMDDERIGRHTFEARVLAALDKYDTKLERMQDFILQIYLKNRKQEE